MSDSGKGRCDLAHLEQAHGALEHGPQTILQARFGSELLSQRGQLRHRAPLLVLALSVLLDTRVKLGLGLFG
jgi:hypothetical protein